MCIAVQRRKNCVKLQNYPAVMYKKILSVLTKNVSQLTNT